jgi:antitoxin component of MazEF toxin-antitoxin module
MNTSSKKFRVTLRDAEDGSDACILPIPDAMMVELTWKDGDTLTIETMADGIVVISNPANGVEQQDEEVVALAEEVIGDRQKGDQLAFSVTSYAGYEPCCLSELWQPKTEVLKMPMTTTRRQERWS